MKIKLQNISEDGRLQFSTDNPKIKKVTFSCVGSDDEFTDFLKMTTIEYIKNKNLLTN